MNYEFGKIESKWQGIWREKKCFSAVDGGDKPKLYLLVEFPYPSGNGLHVGHARPYTAMDIVARKKRMEGFNLLFPMGWDAFGLPAENYAIANKIHPSKVTKTNIDNFRRQIKSIGYSFDWDREISTIDPGYYKWTQWIFIQLFKRGLAYKATMPVNWCTSCKCVLANEEVVEGVCERCGSSVVRKEKSQWMLGITKYAERLIDDLDEVDFLDRVVLQQKNWIGRSEGAEVSFDTNMGDVIKVFTTRPDTLFGATYMVMSPEHELISKWSDSIENIAQVKEYQEKAASKSDLERTELNKEKTGVELKGVSAINPVNNASIPIYISDYVLAGYGTGAIMAVPGHDQRDWEFAKEFGLPIVEVVEGGNIQEAAYTDTQTGKLINSGFLNGLEVDEAKATITQWLEEKGLGTQKVNYKLRDWVFSRQRYWGEPIPIINCDKCGHVALEESQLPLLLPDVEYYEPTETGESPLAKITNWVNVTCPKCGGPAKRETDTMPQWAGSSWYYLRYMDPQNDKELVSPEAIKYWQRVDWYNGGMEHTTLHLLYSRFWHKFLYDIGLVPTKEPYAKRTSHGMILGEDGQKMSKSRGNVVNPSDVIDRYGADTMRLYIMFIGDFEKAAPWSPEAVKGCKRFLDRIWNLAANAPKTGGEGYSSKNEASIHRTIKKVSSDIDEMKFNTAIASLMSLVNEFYENKVSRGDIKALLLMLSPFAPHIADELWESMGYEGMASMQPWPKYDNSKLEDAEKTIAVQINGKLKGTVVVPTDSEDSIVIDTVVKDNKISRFVEDMEIVRSIVVKNRLVNLILKPKKLDN